MSTPIEVLYFPKKCPHCNQPLERIVKMSAEWSQCRNQACPFLEGQPKMQKLVRGIEVERDPEPFICTYNRR